MAALILFLRVEFHMLKRLTVLLMAAGAAIMIGPALSPWSIESNHPTMAVASATELALFTTEDEAQRHCPNDTVVWLNTRTGIYHLKGERWYGRTKHGAYVCKKEARSE